MPWVRAWGVAPGRACASASPVGNRTSVLIHGAVTVPASPSAHPRPLTQRQTFGGCPPHTGKPPFGLFSFCSRLSQKRVMRAESKKRRASQGVGVYQRVGSVVVEAVCAVVFSSWYGYRLAGWWLREAEVWAGIWWRERFQGRISGWYYWRVEVPVRFWQACGRPVQFVPRLPWWSGLVYRYLRVTRWR
jgi:hypothetical protein